MMKFVLPFSKKACSIVIAFVLLSLNCIPSEYRRLERNLIFCVAFIDQFVKIMKANFKTLLKMDLNCIYVFVFKKI